MTHPIKVETASAPDQNNRCGTSVLFALESKKSRTDSIPKYASMPRTSMTITPVSYGKTTYFHRKSSSESAV